MRRCSCCYHRGHRVFHSCGRIALAHGRSRRGRAGGQASRLWSRWRGAHAVGQRLAFRDCLLRRFRFRAVLPACFGRNRSVRRNTGPGHSTAQQVFRGSNRTAVDTANHFSHCGLPGAGGALCDRCRRPRFHPSVRRRAGNIGCCISGRAFESPRCLYIEPTINNRKEVIQCLIVYRRGRRQS